MANKIVLKKSSVAAKVPLTTDLDYGELALNYADEKLYFKNSSNVVKSFNVTQSTLTIGTGLSGTSYNGTSAVTIAIDSTVATLTGTQTLTNKTIAAGSNTISGLTNANLSGSAGITNANLANSSVTVGTTAISLGSSSTTLAGLTSVTSTSFTGALTGNASTATTLQTARTINGVSFNGSANITITANTTNALTIGTGLSGTSFNGGSAVTIAIDSTVATLSGTQTLTNKTISGASNTLSNIPNSALTNSTISGVALGSNLNTLTLNVSGTGLSGSTTYNGSAAATFTVTSNATSANTASTLVARDASGNFTAGTITAALTGNASTATTLQTARTINTVSFNGSANIVVEPYVESDESTNATRYITFVDSTTDGHQRLNEDSNFTINPSTGTVTTNGAFASIFSLNKNTIDTSYSIPSGYNATSAGPVVINNGITVTIPTGSTWVIV